MMLPNFLIIGAARSGTTSLYDYLDQHPQVFVSRIKEPNFFALDAGEPGPLAWGAEPANTFPVRTLEDYEALFAAANEALAVGEASTIYLESRDAPRRIHDQLPEAKLIACLRNPADRAYAGYWAAVRDGEKLGPPESVLLGEWNGVQTGKYHTLLQRYYEHFDRAKIHVVLFDDLRTSPVGVVRTVCRFLDVRDDVELDTTVRHNAGGIPRSRAVHSLLRSGAIRRTARGILPERLRRVVLRLEKRSLAPYPAMTPDLRRRLTELYRGEILQLEDLIERNLSPWLADD